MSERDPTLVVFQGGISASGGLEKLVAEAQGAATLDLLEAASASGAFGRAVLVTEVAGLAEAAVRLFGGWRLPLVVEKLPTRSGEGGAAAFHFGESLLRVCRAYALERVVYVGGGAMPLGAAGE